MSGEKQREAEREDNVRVFDLSTEDNDNRMNRRKRWFGLRK